MQVDGFAFPYCNNLFSNNNGVCGGRYLRGGLYILFVTLILAAGFLCIIKGERAYVRQKSKTHQDLF